MAREIQIEIKNFDKSNKLQVPLRHIPNSLGNQSLHESNQTWKNTTPKPSKSSLKLHQTTKAVARNNWNDKFGSVIPKYYHPNITVDPNATLDSIESPSVFSSECYSPIQNEISERMQSIHEIERSVLVPIK